MNIEQLIARWNTDEGKPYKGDLIDMTNYEEGNLSCMCAQGQVLHVVGGWDAEMLRGVEQDNADAETAKLLNISRTHAILLRHINDSIDGAPAIVLTDPAQVLGDQWSKLLDFWWYMDGLDAEGWSKVAAALDDAWAAAWAAAWDAADAAWVAVDAAGVAADAAGVAALDAARFAADAAGFAAREIQGAEIFKRDGTPFFFLPMFGFASPDDIPPRPADYWVAALQEQSK